MWNTVLSSGRNSVLNSAHAPWTSTPMLLVIKLSAACCIVFYYSRPALRSAPFRMETGAAAKEPLGDELSGELGVELSAELNAGTSTSTLLVMELSAMGCIVLSCTGAFFENNCADGVAAVGSASARTAQSISPRAATCTNANWSSIDVSPFTTASRSKLASIKASYRAM